MRIYPSKADEGLLVTLVVSKLLVWIQAFFYWLFYPAENRIGSTGSKTNIAPETWWSEDDPILFGLGLFWFWGMARLGDLGFQPSTMYRQQKQGTASFRMMKIFLSLIWGTTK